MYFEYWPHFGPYDTTMHRLAYSFHPMPHRTNVKVSNLERGEAVGGAISETVPSFLGHPTVQVREQVIKSLYSNFRKKVTSPGHIGKGQFVAPVQSP